MRPCDLVDPLIGTDSHNDFSFGNVLPLTCLPFATHHFSPVNSGSDRWFFQYRAQRFQGLRLTHQPSPWMGDWRHATLMVQSGERRCRAADRAVDRPSRDLVCKPHRFAATLPGEGLDLDAAPTAHGLVLRIRRRQGQACRLILDTAESSGGGKHASTLRIDVASGEMVATTASGAGHADFRLHLVLRCDAPITGCGTFGTEGEEAGAVSADGPARGAWIDLAAGAAEVHVRLAGSFLDEANARHLLAAEIGEATVDAITERAATAWDALLGRLRTPGLHRDREIFLRTSMYRTLCFPRRLDEDTPTGRRHRCPDTGAVRSGIRVTDNGFWDTARSVYPWFALVYPDLLGDIVEGWLEGARSTGWFASWASPGHRACMTGSYADAVVADALSRGCTGFDAAEALHYLRRHAEGNVDDHCPYGRIGLDAYLKQGYVPVERCTKATARTLDYAYGDWCLARIADHVGDAAFAAACRSRAGNWRQVLDPQTGFFRGRHADGSWVEPFDPVEWGGPYVEGSAWQFAWHVPHDHADLIAARGGKGKALAFLHRLLVEPPRFAVGTYGRVIHEMREMAAVDFGQYAHSNQPSHFTLPYLAHCGDEAGWEHWLHRVLTELHRPTPDGLPGDEDNGELSAWWLLGALGLVADCPGSSTWLRAAPLIREWELHRPGMSMLGLRRIGSGRIWRDPRGTEVGELHVEHGRLQAGGTWTVG